MFVLWFEMHLWGRCSARRALVKSLRFSFWFERFVLGTRKDCTSAAAYNALRKTVVPSAKRSSSVQDEIPWFFVAPFVSKSAVYDPPWHTSVDGAPFCCCRRITRMEFTRAHGEAGM